jgi:palmitoyltransferase ZDHHC9/14/18
MRNNTEALLGRNRMYGLYRRVPVEAAGNCYLLLNGRVVVGPEYLIALISFSVFFICSYILFYTVVPRLEQYSLISKSFYYLTYTSFVSSFVFMLFTATSDPGAIVPAPAGEAGPEQREPRVVECNGVMIKQKWCSSCNFYRPLRSSHCKVTNMHIARFDHMCSFLGTGIGVQNYRWFLLSIYFITLYALLTICVSARYLKIQVELHQALLLKVLLGNFDIVLILLISIIIFLAFGLLVFYHTYITSQNLTMNEQVKKVYTTKNPFDLGSTWKNFMAVFWPQVDPVPDLVIFSCI